MQSLRMPSEIDHKEELMRNRYQHANRSRQSMKIDPIILEGIIRHIVRTDDKDKIMASNNVILALFKTLFILSKIVLNF